MGCQWLQDLLFLPNLILIVILFKFYLAEKSGRFYAPPASAVPCL